MHLTILQNEKGEERSWVVSLILKNQEVLQLQMDIIPTGPNLFRLKSTRAFDRALYLHYIADTFNNNVLSE